MVRRTIGFSDYWSFGPMVHRNIGMSPKLIAASKMAECQFQEIKKIIIIYLFELHRKRPMEEYSTGTINKLLPGLVDSGCLPTFEVI